MPARGDAEDWILERDHPLVGHRFGCSLTIILQEQRKKIFDQFTSGDDYGFTKTVVPVRLAKYGEELNSFLASAGQAGSDELLDGLNIGYDAVLFFGLTVKKRTEVANGLSLLPFEQVQAFIDESLVEELSPALLQPYSVAFLNRVVIRRRWRTMMDSRP